MHSVKCRVKSGAQKPKSKSEGCGMCGVQSAKCGVWSANCRLWSVECPVVWSWSVEFKVWSVERGMGNAQCGA